MHPGRPGSAWKGAGCEVSEFFMLRLFLSLCSLCVCRERERERAQQQQQRRREKRSGVMKGEVLFSGQRRRRRQTCSFFLLFFSLLLPLADAPPAQPDGIPLR